MVKIYINLNTAPKKGPISTREIFNRQHILEIMEVQRSTTQVQH